MESVEALWVLLAHSLPVEQQQNCILWKPKLRQKESRPASLLYLYPSQLAIPVLHLYKQSQSTEQKTLHIHAKVFASIPFLTPRA